MTSQKSNSTDALDAPTIDGVQGGELDPADVPDGTRIRIPPYDGMAVRDRVEFLLRDRADEELSYGDYTFVPARDVGHELIFDIPFSAIEALADREVEAGYTATPEVGLPWRSNLLVFRIGSVFEAEVTLDISAYQYVLAPVPPTSIPDFARFEREATWGTAPYTYDSSNERVATVDASGIVTCMGNGACEISARDRLGQTRKYPLNVKGVLQIEFVSRSADWDGMKAACEVMGLEPVPLDLMKRFWRQYYPPAVATAQGWLSYPFWTADLNGLTPWAYDLNGTSEQGNANSYDRSEHFQVLGLRRE
ncbi:hypothetical protein [Burkholderia sp. BDU5]|uniref:hypothetical protein n=1 Tax=Burkholderia sp. BDU5 TaxID=1385590 RepID=UPI000A7C487E|nr:hypothetical protein [Burkholderia sp. BDU5]